LRELLVLPDGPTARGAATSWRVYLVLQQQSLLVLPLVGRMICDWLTEIG
jgi:hypothetical protein